MRELSGRDKLTESDIDDLKHQIDLFVDQKSLYQRVKNLFNFVNSMWAISIIGMACTVVPCLAFCIGPCFACCFTCCCGPVLMGLGAFLAGLWIMVINKIKDLIL